MPNLPISGLPAASALAGTEPFPAVQGGVTVQATADQIAARAANLGGLGYISGRWYGSFRSAMGGPAVTAGFLYASPIQIWAPVVVQALGLRIGTGSASQAIFAIYTNANGRPANLLTQSSAAVSLSGSNFDATTALASNPTLQPGFYWLASLFSGSPSSVLSLLNTESIMPAWTGATTVGNQQSISGVGKANPFVSGFPGAFGAATDQVQTSTPFINFQAA